MIIVVGLAFEARIAAGPGVRVICSGDGRNLAAKLTAAIADAREHVQGCPGIISFGVAGGLAPQLRPGTCVVGSAVISGENRMPISREWSQKLSADHSGCDPGRPARRSGADRQSGRKARTLHEDRRDRGRYGIPYRRRGRLGARTAGGGDPGHHRSRQARIAGLRGRGDAPERHHQYRRHAPLGAEAAEGIAGPFPNGARRTRRAGTLVRGRNLLGPAFTLPSTT